VAAGLGGGEGAVFLIFLVKLRPLNREAEHAHYAVHRLVLPSHCAAAVGRVVPEAGAGRVQTSSVLLHDHTGH